MGTESFAACHDCRVMAYLGYGSYHSMDRRYARFVGHDGHNTVRWCGDSEWGWEGGVLYEMGSYGTRGDVLVPSRYERIDLSGESSA